MNNHLPLNGSGITDKIRRGLSGGTGGATGSVADVLGSALRGDNTSQPETPQTESTIDGTGFGLSPSHKAPATDPSQGRGNRRPRATEDPIMQAFERMGLA